MAANDMLGIPRRDQSELFLTVCNGYGSTATKIRRWTNITKLVGNAIGYRDDTVYGGLIQILEDGLYTITYTDQFTASSAMGLSLNQVQGATSIGSIAAINRLVAANTAGGTFGKSVSVTVNLKKNDIITAHTGGGTSDTDTFQESLRVTRVRDY